MKREFDKNIGLNNAGRAQETKTQRNHFIFLKNQTGQTSALEFSVFIVCIVIALIAMQKPIARALQGRFHESAESIGAQYDPAHTFVDYNTTSSSSSTSTTTVDLDLTGNLTTTTIISTNYDESTRSGVETVGAY